MSTNYYLKRIPTEDELNTIIAFVKEGKLEDTQSSYLDWNEDDEPASAQAMINKCTRKIHLGKHTDGIFILHKTQKYEASLAGLFQFIGNMLSSKLWTIENEYGEEVDFIEFKNMIKESVRKNKDYMIPNIDWGNGPKYEKSYDNSIWWAVDFN